MNKKKKKKGSIKDTTYKNIILITIEILIFLISISLLFAVMLKKNHSYYQNQNFLYKKVNSNTNEPFIFKGKADNNYISFNNLLWRIVRVNNTGSMVLILDKPINYLPLSINNFDLMSYLNNDFLNELDKTKLIDNNICEDVINDINNIKCHNSNNNYVSLLDVSSYISSIDNGSYITENNNIIWLNNKYDDNNYWHTNGIKISYSSYDSNYAIKPVITLKNDILYESGNGTINDPYIITTNNITIGSKIKIDNDEYTVYSTKDNKYKLSLNKDLNIKIKYENIINYLNKDYYESLKYKDLLLDNDCTEVIINDSITYNSNNKKVCSLNIFDFKINNINDYYLLTKYNKYYFVYNKNIVYGTNNKIHNVIPTITINKDNKFKYDNGIYILER